MDKLNYYLTDDDINAHMIMNMNIVVIIYFMAEEKIRNYKGSLPDSVTSDNIPSFLLKTYEILQNPKYSDIICWTKNGQGFVVKKVKQFAENILPTHFRHSNYTSFVRQLNMYDFHKTRQENQENAFKNSMFKRGQKNLLKQIQRKDYKKKKEKPESTEKIGPTLTQNQFKDIKKTEHEREFYARGLNCLLKIDQEMSNQQNMLANIESANQTDQCISYILDLMFKVKNLNNSWLSQLSSLGKEWQNMINSKRSALKSEIESQKNDQPKKDQGPTMASLHSFSNL